MAERQRLVAAERDRRRAETHQTWVGAPAGFEAAIKVLVEEAATEAMIDAARETIWRRRRQKPSGSTLPDVSSANEESGRFARPAPDS